MHLEGAADGGGGAAQGFERDRGETTVHIRVNNLSPPPILRVMMLVTRSPGAGKSWL